MNAVLDRLNVAPIHDQALRLVMQGALTQFYAFTLVLVRLSGLMIVGPIFGQKLVPANLRVLLVLTLAFLITPAVHDHSRLLFDKLDANHDGRLTGDEVSHRASSKACSGRRGLFSTTGRSQSASWPSASRSDWVCSRFSRG
jgi:hypothetical protein